MRLLFSLEPILISSICRNPYNYGLCEELPLLLFWDLLNKICWFIVGSLLRILQSSPLLTLNNLVSPAKSHHAVEQSRCYYRLIWLSICSKILIYCYCVFYFLTNFVYASIVPFTLWLLGCFNEGEPFLELCRADCHTSSDTVSPCPPVLLT